MTATVDTIRAAIKTTMQTVSNIGVVNDFERYSDQASKLSAQYVATISGSPQLRGWQIRRVAKREVFVDHGRWSVHNRWRIRGFMALNDATESEKTFDSLIAALEDAFRANDTLGGEVMTCIDPETSEAGLQLIESKPVLFAGVLCHSAECELKTQHLI